MTPSFRTVTARIINIKPSKPTYSHKRVVVTGKGQGKLYVLDENGNLLDLDAPEGGNGPSEGEDVVLLVRGQGAGKPDNVVNSIATTKIAERLQRLTDMAAERDVRKAELLQRLADERTERQEARLQRLEENAPASVVDKVKQARGKSGEAGNGPGQGRGGGDDEE